MAHFSLVNVTIGGLSHFIFLNDSSAAETTDNETAWDDPNKLLGEKCQLGDEQAFSGECGMIEKNGCIFGDDASQETLPLFGEDDIPSVNNICILGTGVCIIDGCTFTCFCIMSYNSPPSP